MLKKENQCLKNEIKNHQAVMKMLITNDNCTDDRKTVKSKCKNNTNIASSSFLSSKISLAVNLQNRFDNLIVTEIKQSEIHKPQDHKPTNHHKLCEITNAKSKSRAEKIISTASVHLVQ